MIYFLFPETKGLSLEEIDFLFLKRERLSPEDGIVQANPSPGSSEEKVESHVESVQ